jgi:hypothetical protein
MKTKLSSKSSWFAGNILTGLLGIAVSLSPAHAVSVLAGCSGTGFCTMTELLAGGSITIDNKKFDTWTFSGTATAPNGDNHPLSSDLISVKPLGEGETSQGLLFTGPGLASNETYDFAMKYDVSTLDSSETLHGYAFSIGFPGVSGNADGFAATEVVNDSSGNEIACGGVDPCQEPVYTRNDPLKSASFTDEVSGLAVNSNAINIGTNAILRGDTGSFSSLSIEQRILGVPAVPIPSTLLLFGSGLMGLFSMRKRLKV